MTLPQLLTRLRRAGSAQTRKIYARHGAQEPMFGVSYAVLKDLAKEIGIDDDLAVALWDSGNHDARMLAVRIADPALGSVARLNRWVRDADGPLAADAVGAYASRTKHAAGRVALWTKSRREWTAVAGWMALAFLATFDEETSEEWFEPYVRTLAAGIHARPNSAREAMNRALIAIGCRTPKLRRLATAAASRIGPVDVDHGDTCCETPDAAAYIAKTWAHRARKSGRTTPKRTAVRAE